MINYMIISKQCPRCKKAQSIENFHQCLQTKDGLAGHCKICRKEYRRVNKEKIHQKQKEWRMTHKEYIQKKAARKYVQNKDEYLQRSRQRYIQNKDGIHEYNRIYNRDHKERKQLWQHQYYVQNKKQIDTHNKEWQQIHPEHGRIYTALYRSRKFNTKGFHVLKDMQLARIKQNDKCYYCDINLNQRGHWEHKVPLAREGTNWPNNMCWACAKCNHQKATKTDIEYLAFLSQLSKSANTVDSVRGA